MLTNENVLRRKKQHAASYFMQISNFCFISISISCLLYIKKMFFLLDWGSLLNIIRPGALELGRGDLDLAVPPGARGGPSGASVISKILVGA